MASARYTFSRGRMYDDQEICIAKRGTYSSFAYFFSRKSFVNLYSDTNGSCQTFLGALYIGGDTLLADGRSLNPA